jgi:hypothetical protein
VRCVLGILFLSGLSLGMADAAVARERLVMPYTCVLEHGRVTLSPGTERSYAIVGTREVASVATCRSQRSTSCQILMVHRFAISCGEARVAWMRVAAAIRQANAAPAWIEEGRLNLVLPVHHRAVARGPCIVRPTFSLGHSEFERRVAYTGDCSGRQTDFDHVVLPAGFAPIEELDVRLEDVTATAPDLAGADQAEDEDQVPLRHVAAGAQESLVARADSDTIVEPIPGLERFDADTEPTLASDDWVTVVRAERDFSAAGVGDVGAPGAWAWFLAAMALVTAAGLIHVRPSSPWPAVLDAISPVMTRATARLATQLRGSHWWRRWHGHAAPESFANAGAAVDALLKQTESLVSELKGVGPLREVLQSELKLVRRTLRSVEAAASVGGGDETQLAMRSASHYRALVRELERIHRIAESAAASLSGARPAGSVPRTASEAYDVLGVNPDVSEGVLKKIVDALRMSWHPDHARDQEDRLLREDRMRQINVAWDLISGAREVA